MNTVVNTGIIYPSWGGDFCWKKIVFRKKFQEKNLHKSLQILMNPFPKSGESSQILSESLTNPCESS